MQAVTGRVIAGRYQLLSCVGQGAMGTVWRASDPVLGREVAVKEIRLPGLMPEQERRVLRERTLREARVAAKLSHPAVVTVYDVVETDGNPWIVMEYVRARSLQRVLDEDGALPAPRVAAIGAMLLDALASAHAVGVVHRDVKPANVLIAVDGRAVLTDFGIATMEGDPGLTQAGMVMGTPGFCAPERIRGEPASPASDLWSLGATLYAAVQGHAPFRSQESAMAVLALIANSDPPAAAAAGPLSPVISALMSRDPRGRPDAAAAHRMLGQARRALSDAQPAHTASSEARTAPAEAHITPAGAHTTPAGAHTTPAGARAGWAASHGGAAGAHAILADAAAGQAACGTGAETPAAPADSKGDTPSEVAWTWPPRDISCHLPRAAPDGACGIASERTAPLPVIPYPPALGAGASPSRSPSGGSAPSAPGSATAGHPSRPSQPSQPSHPGRPGGAATVGAARAPNGPGSSATAQAIPRNGPGSATAQAIPRNGSGVPAAGRRPAPRSGRRMLVLVCGLAIGGLGLLTLGLMAHAARAARVRSGAPPGRSGPADSLPPGYRWYSAPPGTPLVGLSMAVPRDWLVAQSGARIVASDRAAGSAIAIAPVPAGALGPLRATVLLSRQVRAGAFPGFHRVAVGSALVRGMAADTLAFTYVQPGRGAMEGLAVIISSPGPDGRTEYEFLASAPLSHWAATRAVLAEALRTVAAGP